MRARNIKPGFFTNEILGTADPMVCLLFAGLWCLADKDGRLEDRPLRIKAELFPYRDNLDVNGYLTVLEQTGFISRYEVDGKRYIQVENFAKHQSPHHTERPKGYPGIHQDSSGLRRKQALAPLSNGECQVPERSDSLIPDSLIPDSLIPDSLIPDSKARPSVLSSADADDPVDKVHDPVPYQAVVSAYNEICGDLFVQALKITSKRRTAIKGRWNADKSNSDERKRTNNLDYWRRYFAYCRDGVEFFRRASSGDTRGQHASWKPDFDFLMRESTWLGVKEGRYQ